MSLSSVNFELIRFISAKLVIGTTYTQEIRDCVDTLMNDGFYLDEFLEIIDSCDASLEEIKSIFKKILKIIGIDLPSENKSIWIIIAYYFKKIASNVDDPLKIFQKIMFDVNNFPGKENPIAIKDIGKDFGVGYLVLLYETEDEFLAYPKKPFLKNLLRKKTKGLRYEYFMSIGYPTHPSFNGKYGLEGIKELKKEFILEVKKWLEENDKQYQSPERAFRN